MGCLALPHLRSAYILFRYVALSTEYGDVAVPLSKGSNPSLIERESHANT